MWSKANFVAINVCLQITFAVDLPDEMVDAKQLKGDARVLTMNIAEARRKVSMHNIR
jgi:hypothetical protein